MSVEWLCAYIMFGAFSLEAVVSLVVLRDGRHQIRDTAVNLAIMLGYVAARMVIGAFVAVILLAIYSATPLRWSMTWWHWGLLFLLNDFLYYWSHRLSHQVRPLWAFHVVHHNSAILNLSTGLRNSWLGGFIDWIFFVPMAALGFQPLHIAAVIAVMSAWDFMTHSPYLRQFPVLDVFMNTPANHRVHHARNPEYVDKNFGGATMVWDHLFGTYAQEVRKPEYGIEQMPAHTYNPVHLQFHVWREMIHDPMIPTGGKVTRRAEAATDLPAPRS